MLEAPLRDLLSAQLDVLEGGLTLLDIEAFIPASIGTRSFIDLLAKDTKNRWVLIELKRSDAAARQAIHEIYKYVEAVKRHLGARDDEIRAIVVSTEWQELLVPFSRFVNDTDISVYGVKIKVEDTGSVITAEVMEPLPFTSGRILSPWHEISLYRSEDRLEAGVASYDASCAAKGVLDYIMVTMKAPEGFYEMSVIATAQALYDMGGGVGNVPDDAIRDTADKLERLDYMIYFVPALQSAEEYLEMTKRSPSLYKEAKGFSRHMEGEELLQSLQSYAFDAEPKVDRDYFEIGYPAKFQTKLLEEEGWEIKAVLRRGAFSRNSVLTDETILGEIAGDAGTSGQRLKRSVALSDKAEWSQVTRDLEACLLNNPVWLAMIKEQLEEAKKDYPKATADISIFAPSAGLFTVFFAATQENGALYVPSYSLVIKTDGNERRGYFGDMVPFDDAPADAARFSTILAKYYENDLGLLVMSMVSGAYEARDVDVLESANLAYESFRCDFDNQNRTFFRKRNGRWRSVSTVAMLEGFNRYLETNAGLVGAIVYKLRPRVGNGMCDGTAASIQLKELVQKATLKKKQVRNSSLKNCEVCGVPLDGDTFLSEGVLTRNTKRAAMCADCTVYYSDHYTPAQVQLFTKTKNGDWHLAADPMPLDRLAGIRFF